MHFDVSAVPAEIPGVMAQMAGMLSWKSWEDNLTKIRQDIQAEPFWREFLYSRYALELACGDIRSYFSKTKRYPWPPKTRDQLRFYSFAIMIVRIYSHLDCDLKSKLMETLRKHLNGDFGLAPLALEMTVVSHFMSKGFDVHFNDLKNDGGYDFLIGLDGVEAEIECKYISTDLGRQIHRQAMYNFSKLVLPYLTAYLSNLSFCRIVIVTLPGRLPSNKKLQEKIAGCIDSSLRNKPADADYDICSIQVVECNLKQIPFIDRPDVDRDSIRQYMASEFEIESAQIIPAWRPGQSAVILALKSQKSDKVLKAIHKKLREDSKKQFSKDRPAILCVGLEEVEDEDIQKLYVSQSDGKPPGIQLMANDLLIRRPHLHSVGFMSQGNFRKTSSRTMHMQKTSWSYSGHIYSFSNPHHPSHADPILSDLFY